MMDKFSLWPVQASSFAWKIDAVYLFTIALCLFCGIGVFLAVIYFVVKYRRRSDDEIPEQIEGNMPLEIFWSVAPLGIAMVLFFWGTMLFFELSSPPAESLNF